MQLRLKLRDSRRPGVLDHGLIFRGLGPHGPLDGRTDPARVVRSGIGAGQHRQRRGRPLEDRVLAELSAEGACLLAVESDHSQACLHVLPSTVATRSRVVLQCGFGNPSDQSGLCHRVVIWGRRMSARIVGGDDVKRAPVAWDRSTESAERPWYDLNFAFWQFQTQYRLV